MVYLTQFSTFRLSVPAIGKPVGCYGISRIARVEMPRNTLPKNSRVRTMPICIRP